MLVQDLTYRSCCRQHSQFKRSLTLEAQRNVEHRRWRLLMDPVFRKQLERSARRRKARSIRTCAGLRVHLYKSAACRLACSSSLSTCVPIRLLRGAGRGDDDEMQTVSADSMQNPPVCLTIPPLIVGNVVLSDRAPKELLLPDGSHEADANRFQKLSSFLHKMYVSCETSGFQCACALHAPFGVTSVPSGLFFPNARQTASRITRCMTNSDDIRQQIARESLVDLIRKDLVAPHIRIPKVMSFR